VFRIASRLSHRTWREADNRSTYHPTRVLRTASLATMDQQRGRSPSTSNQQSQYKSEHSPSPHQFQDNQNAVGLGLGLETANQRNNQQQYLNGGSFNSGNNFMNQQGQNFSNFTPNQDFNQQFKQEDQQSGFNPQQQPSFTQELMGANNNFEGDFSLFSTPNHQGDQLDPRFFMNELSPQSGNSSVNPTELNNMSSPPNNATTPPSLLQPESRPPSSAHQSPSFNQGQFQPSPAHSRHASLGPESAAFPQSQNHMEWNMMASQFQGHRRTPSEYSDVSVSSAAPSPNLGHHDSFEPLEHHHSPNLNAGNDPMYDQVLGIGSFSLSDPQVQHASPGRGLSPAHSPSISPRLGPQQLPNVHQNQFMLGINNGFGGSQNMYGSQDSEYPQITHNGSIDMGQAQQMIPPEINVEFAPTSRTNSFDPPKPSSFDTDALTPPDRGMKAASLSSGKVANLNRS
jgi:hypothetical protein